MKHLKSKILLNVALFKFRVQMFQLSMEEGSKLLNVAVTSSKKRKEKGFLNLTILIGEGDPEKESCNLVVSFKL